MCSSVCKFIRQVSLIGIFVALCLPLTSEASYFITVGGGVSISTSMELPCYSAPYSAHTETSTYLEGGATCTGSTASSSANLVTGEFHAATSTTDYYTTSDGKFFNPYAVASINVTDMFHFQGPIAQSATGVITVRVTGTLSPSGSGLPLAYFQMALYDTMGHSYLTLPPTYDFQAGGDELVVQQDISLTFSLSDLARDLQFDVAFAQTEEGGGAGDLTAKVVSFTLPPGVTFTSDSGGFQIQPPPPVNYSVKVFTCTDTTLGVTSASRSEDCFYPAYPGGQVQIGTASASADLTGQMRAIVTTLALWYSPECKTIVLSTAYVNIS